MIPKELEKMLAEIRTPVIFASGASKPHATPMNWCYEKGALWISPAGGTKKVERMKESSSVCVACLEGMRKGARGFMLWGEIVSMETGVKAFLKHALILKRMLNEKSETAAFGRKLLKYAYVYYRHPDIYYSAFPWTRYFAKIMPKKIVYWLEDGIKKEVTSPTQM